MDSNHRIQQSKCCALPLGECPMLQFTGSFIYIIKDCRDCVSHIKQNLYHDTMITFTLCGTNPTGTCDVPLISIPLVGKGGVLKMSNKKTSTRA